MKLPDRTVATKPERLMKFAPSLFTVWILLFLAPLSWAEPVKILVVGLEGEALKNVEAALSLPPGLVRDGKVDLLWFERFAGQAEQNTRKALEPFGYYRVEVLVTTETREGGNHLLRVEVNPGEPVRVAEVKVNLRGPGSREEILQEMINTFPLGKGDVLRHQLYERAKGALQARTVEMGYREARFTVHEIRIDESLSSCRIELVLETGARHHFGEVTIQGAPDYPDAFLRRYLSFQPGEVFSSAKFTETQRNYRNSERFQEISVSARESRIPENTVPVAIELTQAPSRSLRTGIGYGTDTGARFTARWRDLNLFQRGHELSENLFISEQLQGLASTYVIQGLPDDKSFLSTQINLQQEDIDAYRSRLIAVEPALSRRFRDKMVGTAYLRLLYEDSTIGDGDSQYFSVLPGLRLIEDRYDNPIRPTRGFHYALEVRGTHDFMGSDMGLLQGIAEGSRLTPLPWDLILHTRASAGFTIQSDPISEVPPSLRFFTGGDQSVRGYAYKSLAPKDADGDLAGGKHLLTASVELERPVYKDWSLSVFYDVGNAFDSFSSLRLHQGAGIGLHYYAPFGALNLSVARQINEEEPSYRIHFTAGFHR